MKAFLKISLFVILVVGLSVPMLAQGTTPPGMRVHQVYPPGHTVNWTITLNQLTVGTPPGTASYSTFKMTGTGKLIRRFSVECDYANYADGTMFDVFVNDPSITPENTFVGSMEGQNGYAELVLVTAKAPLVTKGTKSSSPSTTGRCSWLGDSSVALSLDKR